MRPPRSHTALDELRVPVRAELAAAWASVMFLYIYVDYFQLFKPGYVGDILAGRVAVYDISQTFVVIGFTVVAVPSLMILLSTTLPARADRATNLVVATLYLPVSVYNAVGESWTWFFGLTIGLEVLLLAFILRRAWTWPRHTASEATLAAGLDSEPLRAPQQA